ncbi:MAG TPA: two-component regulator propeller domain-containing protein, partial [Ideonella sp.]|nr:two-component regulator propeller domain-containing protein [Ideonella sp.]
MSGTLRRVATGLPFRVGAALLHLHLHLHLCGLALLAGLAAGPGAARAAADRDPAWFPYHHTAWAVADGAPAGISGLAQTADGYLWLGAATGLFRFDGVRFERFEPPAGQTLRSRNISALAALPSGALWVGHRFGGASRWAAGRIDNYGAEQGLPGGTLLAFTEDAQGRTWASSSRGVALFDGKRWQQVGLGGAADGPDDQAVYALMADRQGAIWASADQGVYVLRPGETRFSRASEAGGFAWMVQAPDGQVWASQGLPGLRPWSLETLGRERTESGGFSLGGETGAFAFDRRGSLWVGTPPGVLRLPSADWQQRGSAGGGAGGGAGRPGSAAGSLPPAFSRQQGLSGEIVLAMLEDHEGTVWLGTNGGLDRFRRNKLNRAALPPELLWFALAAGADGNLWVGGASRALYRLRPGETLAVDKLTEVGGRITSAFRDRQGRLWMGGAEGLWRSVGEGFERVALPEAMAGSPMQAMAQNRAGDLLVA